MENVAGRGILKVVELALGLAPSDLGRAEVQLVERSLGLATGLEVKMLRLKQARGALKAVGRRGMVGD